ncbi:MAG: PAS domain S-box protein [Flavisolibacter sp.]
MTSKKGSNYMGYEAKIYEAAHFHEALLNELLKRSSQGIVLLDPDGKILFCSQSIHSITGYESGELVGRSAFDFFHPSDLDAARQQYEYLMELTENASAALIQILGKQDEVIWIDVVVKNLFHLPQIHALFCLVKRSTDMEGEERRIIKAVTDAQEQEKEFLALELHDNINQIITATKLLVEMARQSSRPQDWLPLASSNLQLAADEIKKLSSTMLSFDLSEYGLASAIETFIATLSRASDVSFELRLDAAAAAVLSADQQLHLYRIIQEGVNNMVRHSGAKRAEIILSKTEELVYLTITDNGTGFSMSQLKKGIGLKSITNRIKLLKGHFYMRAPRGKGTTIEIHFPV